MPLYQVIAQRDLLTDDLRRRIAGEITRIHTTNTGAPAVFVNVLFQDPPAAGHLFTAGEPSRTTIIVATSARAASSPCGKRSCATLPRCGPRRPDSPAESC